MFRISLLFSCEAGVEPDWPKRRELAWARRFGPLPEVSFRLDGPARIASPTTDPSPYGRRTVDHPAIDTFSQAPGR